MKRRNHFIILGNGGGGTSLLRGLLNAHSQVDCLFEHRIREGNAYAAPGSELIIWKAMAAEAGKAGKTWGNKIPIEQFKTRLYMDSDVLKLADCFHIIWIIRRFSKYMKPRADCSERKYSAFWDWGRDLHWRMKEAHPDTVVRVSFEDLVLRPKAELSRITNFLGLKYEPAMMKGTLDTGFRKYNQPAIDSGKA